MGALLQKKVEDWLALAVASYATANRLAVYTGEADDGDRIRVRPSIVIICDEDKQNPTFSYVDNSERIATASVYIASPADKKTAIHNSLAAGLEEVLRDVETVKGFASDVGLLYVYTYEPDDAVRENDDNSRTRMNRYTFSVICRDDSGV